MIGKFVNTHLFIVALGFCASAYASSDISGQVSDPTPFASAGALTGGQAMKRILRARALVALLVAQSLGGPLLAQSNQIGATISGTVVDAQGGTVQSATVSLAKEGDSQPFLSIRTDAGGIFRFPAVEAGTYRLSISAKGFEEFARIIETSRDAGSELEITMRVSGAHQSVTITELGPYVTPDATSATKQDTPIMETPVSVHVVPAAVLRDQQAVSLQTAIQNISGVIQSNDSYGTGDSFVIRGFDQRQTTYEDGLRLDQYTNFGLPQDLANIELVEVVKGPESVLYGQAEPGGLVNVVTKKPQDAPDYNFQQFGSYGFYRTTAGATGPLAAHRLFYRIDLDYAKAGSFRNFIHSDHFSIFPSVQWRPSGRDQLTFSFYFGKGTLVSDNGIPFLSNGTPANVPLSRNFADPGVNRDPIREYYFKLLASHSLTDKWKVRIAYKSQYTDAPTPNFQAYIGDADPTGNLTLFAFTESYSNHWTHQAVTDITGEFDTFGIHHNAIVGFDFYDDYGGYDANTYLPPSINIFAPVWNQPYQLPDPWTNFVVANGETAYGAYIQDQVNLKHHMHLLAGLRFDRVHTYDKGVWPGIGGARPAQTDAARRHTLATVFLPERLRLVYGELRRNRTGSADDRGKATAASVRSAVRSGNQDAVAAKTTDS